MSILFFNVDIKMFLMSTFKNELALNAHLYMLQTSFLMSTSKNELTMRVATPEHGHSSYDLLLVMRMTIFYMH